MARKMIDCRSMPSEIGCTLTIAGEEDEVLDAAMAHAVRMQADAILAANAEDVAEAKAETSSAAATARSRPLPTFTTYLEHMSVLTEEKAQEIDQRIKLVGRTLAASIRLEDLVNRAERNLMYDGREPILLDGEGPEALAPETARRLG